MRKTLLYGLIVVTLIFSAFVGLPRGVMADKLIAITFDDGPGPYTDQLLDGLAKRKVPATFFLLGSNVKKYPSVVKRTYREGHQIANHSWDHPNFNNLSQSEVLNQITKTENAIDSAVGTDVGKLMVRPPYGNITSAQKSAVGRKLIHWSVDPLDWQYRNATTVKNNIVGSAREGSIILVHDIYSTSVTGALAAIDELKKKGYTFVTVSELFRRKGINMVDGKMYYNAPANGVDLGPPAPPDPYAFDESKLSEYWAYEAICYVKENGIMVGFSERKFGPLYPMTRAMFASVLSRMAGEEITAANMTPFSDVASGKYYAAAIAWAAEKGIVCGYGNGKFGPDDYVTREQAAVMIVNYMSYKGFTLNENAVLGYTDNARIHSWAQPYVAMVSDKGIMVGMGNNSFAPLENISRAQAASLLMRLHQMQL